MKHVILTYIAKLSMAVLIIAGSISPSTANLTPTSSASERSSIPTSAPSGKPKKIGIVLYDGFETLDVYGPVEMWARLPDYELVLISQHGGVVKSAQGFETLTSASFATAPQFDILMVPGGPGSRSEVDNPEMLAFIRKQDRGTEWTTSVCTGSAVLAKAGILDGRKATSNKVAFAWATSQSNKVSWQTRARWVIDGKYVTSSGVSAGTDMALALVDKLYGREVADQTARFTEYIWNDDFGNDPFAVEMKD